MNDILSQIFEAETVSDASGKSYPLSSAIDGTEADFLTDVARRAPRLDRSLKVGCAYGVASLALCEVLRERSTFPSHIIVDPFQYRDWNAIGVTNLDRAGFGFYSLLEEGSEFALPKLASERSGTFDLIFIDGWHTFD